MTERCSACHAVRDLAEMLRVTETGGLRRSRFVCRPNVAPRCFGSVGLRDHEAIATALPDVPLRYRPRGEGHPQKSPATGSKRPLPSFCITPHSGEARYRTREDVNATLLDL